MISYGFTVSIKLKAHQNLEGALEIVDLTGIVGPKAGVKLDKQKAEIELIGVLLAYSAGGLLAVWLVTICLVRISGKF